MMMMKGHGRSRPPVRACLWVFLFLSPAPARVGGYRHRQPTLRHHLRPSPPAAVDVLEIVWLHAPARDYDKGSLRMRPAGRNWTSVGAVLSGTAPVAREQSDILGMMRAWMRGEGVYFSPGSRRVIARFE